MSGPVLLAVDGGNTKTQAVVVAEGGRVIGAARGGTSDMYATPTTDDAVAVVLDTARSALADAGASPADVVVAAYGMAGVDWPEDRSLLEAAFLGQVGPAVPMVFNDGLGALWAGTGGAHGVAAGVGTYLAVGASGPLGTWHASFWAQQAGAIPLGQAALQAVYRAELELAPPTDLTDAVRDFFGYASVELLLHAFTSRSRRPAADAAAIAPLVFDHAAAGDAVARDLVSSEARSVAETVFAAGVRVGLGPGHDLVLTGGLLRHESRLLEGLIADLLPEVAIVRPTVEPVAGVVLLAACECGFPVDRALLEASLAEMVGDAFVP